MRAYAERARRLLMVEQTGGVLHAFCGAVGTAGMLTGVSKALKAGSCAARIVALEPVSAPMLTQGHGGTHRVEGIAPGFEPPHLTPGVYDEARAVDESDARAMARRIAREEGVFAGTSSALNVVAAGSRRTRYLTTTGTCSRIGWLFPVAVEVATSAKLTA